MTVELGQRKSDSVDNRAGVCREDESVASYACLSGGSPLTSSAGTRFPGLARSPTVGHSRHASSDSASSSDSSAGDHESVLVIGGGWFGVVIALELAEKGYKVTIVDKNKQLFGGISGKFGIRIHNGLHYALSEVTQDECSRGYVAFTSERNELVVSHEYSIYAIGEEDSQGRASKISAQDFIELIKRKGIACKDLITERDEIAKRGYNPDEVEMLAYVHEPSCKVGRGLGAYYQKLLVEAGVQVVTDYNVESVAFNYDNDNFTVKGRSGTDARLEDRYGKVVNATSFQAFVPSRDKFNTPFDTYYQALLAIKVKDRTPGKKPISTIMVDGLFPCLMPYVEIDEGGNAKIDPESFVNYVVTHAEFTTLGSFKTVKEAWECISSLKEHEVREMLWPLVREQMMRFWPGFAERFEYAGYETEVLAKAKNGPENRTAYVAQEAESCPNNPSAPKRGGMVHIFPGKISNTDAAAKAVRQHFKDPSRDDHNVAYNEEGNYFCVQGGPLDASRSELTGEITDEQAGAVSCNMNTLQRLRNGDFTIPRMPELAVVTEEAELPPSENNSPAAQPKKVVVSSARVDGVSNMTTAIALTIVVLLSAFALVASTESECTLQQCIDLFSGFFANFCPSFLVTSDSAISQQSLSSGPGFFASWNPDMIPNSSSADVCESDSLMWNVCHSFGFGS